MVTLKKKEKMYVLILKLNQIEKDAMTAEIGMWRQWTHEFCYQRSIDK